MLNSKIKTKKNKSKHIILRENPKLVRVEEIQRQCVWKTPVRPSKRKSKNINSFRLQTNGMNKQKMLDHTTHIKYIKKNR